MDLALDPRTHDLAFAAAPGGRAALGVVEGPRAVAQRLKIALLTLLGEWRFDTTHGTPWTQAILVKGASQASVAALLRRRALSVPGVTRITALGVTINPATRRATVELRADTDGGPVALSVASPGLG